MFRLRRLLVAASLVALGSAALPAARAEAEEQPPTAPTYRIFATREGLVGHRTANGHRIQPRDRFVALPSWNVLSSKGGNEFQVRVTYKGRSVVLPVWDVGPWNTRDEYWSADRKYSDLPVGVPMAYAAYNDGYNGGKDEFGRRVKVPNGIDIADGAFWDDLGMVGSDWVEVSFLWLGSDPGAPGAAPATPEPAPEPAAAPVATALNALVQDDGAQGYSARSAVTWYDEPCGLNNKHQWTYGTRDPSRSENRAVWNATLPGFGFYEAMAYIPACGRPATEAARYRVAVGEKAVDIAVNQRAHAGGWASLGIYHTTGTAQIELSDITGDDGQAVRFDAVQWVPRIDGAPPEARVIAGEPLGDGSVLVRWQGSDDVSGVAAYDVQVRQLPDGGWSNWQVDAVTVQAAFVPPGPGAYAFRARARDWVGNQQLWRDADDLAVTVGG